MQAIDLNIASQLVQILLTILSLGIAFFALLQQRTRKELSYKYYASNWSNLEAILQRIDRLHGRSLLPKMKCSADAQILWVTLINSGNVPIASKDFERPIGVSFKAPSKIIGTNQAVFDPEELPASITVDQNTILISPVLLNPGNWILLKLLVEDFAADRIKVTGHIAGVSNIKRRRIQVSRAALAGVCLVGAAQVVILGLGTFYYEPGDFFHAGIAAVLLGITSLGLLFLSYDFNQSLKGMDRVGKLEGWEPVESMESRQNV